MIITLTLIQTLANDMHKEITLTRMEHNVILTTTNMKLAKELN